MKNKNSYFNLPPDTLVTLSVANLAGLIEGGVSENETTFQTNNLSEILTIDQLCEITGYKKATIYRKVYDGDLHVLRRHGRKLLFARQDVMDWLEGKEVKSDFEKKQEEKFKKARRNKR